MSKHGGFGLALQITEQRLNQLLVMAHRVGRLPRWVAMNVPPISDVDGTGQASLALAGWVDAPQIELKVARPDTVRVAMRVVGKLTIHADSVSATAREVRVSLKFDAGVDISLQSQIVNHPWPLMDQMTYDAAAQFSPVTVVDSDLVVLNGPPLPDAWLSFFKGQLFRIGAGFQLAKQLSNVVTVLPDEFVPFVDLLRVGQGTTVKGMARAGDGFLSLVFDVASSELGVATAGKLADIEDFLGFGNVAAVIDAALTPILTEGIRHMMNVRLIEAGEGATVTSLGIELKTNHLHVSGHAEADFGGGDFSLDAKPRIGKPEQVEVVDDEYGQWNLYIPPTDEIWVDLTNVSVDTDPAWWLYAFGIPAAATLLFVPVTGLAALAAIAGSISDWIAAIPIRIVDQGEKTLMLAHQKRRLLGPNSVLVAIEIGELSVFSDLVITRIRLDPDSSAAINGSAAIPIQGIDSMQKYTLTADPLLWDGHDPEARIRWQIRRIDTGQPVYTIERSASDSKATRISVNFADLGGYDPTVSAFQVQVRVFRPGGWIGFDYFNRTLKMIIEDRLDRSHPYVRWHRDIVALSLGKIVIHRRSALHRTAYPGRCNFADRYSYKLDVPPQYLDELPFPVAEIQGHRKEICDYCFYGGPDKHKLIFDPAAPT